MVPNISALTVRQFSQGIVDMAHDSSGLTDHLLYRLLFTPKILNSHAHKQALPAYFDVSEIILLYQRRFIIRFPRYSLSSLRQSS